MTILWLMLSIACVAPWKNRMMDSNLSADIICYHDGEVIFEGESAGEVLIRSNSGEIMFFEPKTYREVSIVADCMVTTKQSKL